MAESAVQHNVAVTEMKHDLADPAESYLMVDPHSPQRACLSRGPLTSRYGPAHVPHARARTCYAVLSSEMRSQEEEGDMSAQGVLLVIGAIGGAAALSWWLVRFVSGYRYRKLVKDRLEALELGVRIRSACS